MGMLEALGRFIVTTRKIPRIVIGLIVGGLGMQIHYVSYRLTWVAGCEHGVPAHTEGVRMIL
jgi:hypothetical protein